MITCPNCGKEIPATSKFCTYCGAKITAAAAQPSQAAPAQPQPAQPSQTTQTNPTGQAQFQQGQANQSQPNQSQPQPPQPNPNVEATKQYAQGYWRFLTSSLSHPYTMNGHFHKYFGVTSLAVNALFVALSTSLAVTHTANGVSNFAGNIFGDLGSSTVNNATSGLGGRTFFGVLIFILGLFFVLASVAFLVANVFLGDKRLGYLDSLNQFAHFSNISVFASAVAALLALVGATGVLGSLCLIVNLTFIGTAFVATIFKAKPTNGFDKLYAYVLGSLLAGVVMVVVALLLGASLLGSVLSNL